MGFRKKTVSWGGSYSSLLTRSRLSSFPLHREHSHQMGISFTFSARFACLACAHLMLILFFLQERSYSSYLRPISWFLPWLLSSSTFSENLVSTICFFSVFKLDLFLSSIFFQNLICLIPSHWKNQKYREILYFNPTSFSVTSHSHSSQSSKRNVV